MENNPKMPLLDTFTGSRTIQHFNQAEDSKRFTKPEVYRRPATNIPGQIGMEYGRPSVGYYAPRNPSKQGLSLSFTDFGFL